MYIVIGPLLFPRLWGCGNAMFFEIKMLSEAVTKLLARR